MRTIVLLIFALILTGCDSTYVVPAGGAHPAALSENGDDGWRFSAKPTAQFPARIAIARVQACGYRSNDTVTYGGGLFSVVTSSQTGLLDAGPQLNALPQIAGIAVLNSILLPPNLSSDADLRRAAGRLGADMLLLYTFNDSVRVDDHEIGPLGILSLGTLPNHEAKVVASCEAALLDVRSGYVYATVEASADESQFSGFWTTESALDRARVKAEQAALNKLVPQFATAWNGVLTQYAYAPARPPMQTSERYETQTR